MQIHPHPPCQPPVANPGYSVSEERASDFVPLVDSRVEAERFDAWDLAFEASAFPAQLQRNEQVVVYSVQETVEADYGGVAIRFRTPISAPLSTDAEAAAAKRELISEHPGAFIQASYFKPSVPYARMLQEWSEAADIYQLECSSGELPKLLETA